MLVLGLALLGSLITALKAAKLSLLLLQDKHPISILKEMAALGQLGLWSSCIVRQFGVPERLKTKLGERIKSERGTPVRAEHKPTFRSRNARREDGRAAIAQRSPPRGAAAQSPTRPPPAPARSLTVARGRWRSPRVSHISRGFQISRPQPPRAAPEHLRPLRELCGAVSAAPLLSPRDDQNGPSPLSTASVAL